MNHRNEWESSWTGRRFSGIKDQQRVIILFEIIVAAEQFRKSFLMVTVAGLEFRVFEADLAQYCYHRRIYNYEDFLAYKVYMFISTVIAFGGHAVAIGG